MTYEGKHRAATTRPQQRASARLRRLALFALAFTGAAGYAEALTDRITARGTNRLWLAVLHHLGDNGAALFWTALPVGLAMWLVWPDLRKLLRRPRL